MKWYQTVFLSSITVIGYISIDIGSGLLARFVTGPTLLGNIVIPMILMYLIAYSIVKTTERITK